MATVESGWRPRAVVTALVCVAVMAMCVTTLRARMRSRGVRIEPVAAALEPAHSGAKTDGAGAAGAGARELDAHVAGEQAAVAFSDAALAAGIDFVHDNGARGQWYLCEIMSGGGGFFDYDNDGWLDVFLTQGGEVGAGSPGPTCRLYRNGRNGSFVDVTAESGAGVAGYAMGCAAGDYDGDGWCDLYVTRVGPDVLLRNNGDGTFSDVTAASGLGDAGYASSAAWFDYDRDGRLDLYVVRYIAFDARAQIPCNDFAGQRDYCDPTAHAMVRHLLYHNAGNGRFEDVSARAGVSMRSGYGLAVAASDFDGDGWTDVYVANDQSPALLWRNQGDGTFVDEAISLGCALSGEGVAIAGMGIAAEDFDRDGDFDLFITNIRNHSNLFLRNGGAAGFEDVSARWGRTDWMMPYTGFGVAAIDHDHDGRLELFVANGAVMRGREAQHAEGPYAEPNQFLHADAEGRYADASAALDAGVRVAGVSRGVAAGDYDNDGDVDLLVCRNGARPQLLRNDSPRRGSWLSVLPMDAAGRGPVLNAWVELEVAGQRRLAECRAQQSYLATCDPRIHFGLGDAAAADAIRVRWPDGTWERFAGTSTNQFLRLRRGTGRPDGATP